jgi:hypothetical protein
MLAGLALAAVVLVIIIELLLLGPPRQNSDIGLEVAKGLMNLLSALLVTGILSIVISQRSSDRARRDDERRTLSAALNELKAGYECTLTAWFFLRSHPTGKTYLEQIEHVIAARSRLQRVQRERFVLGTEVEAAVQEMLDVLLALMSEFSHGYRQISADALTEDAVREALRSGDEEADLAGVPALRSTEFPHLHGFMAAGEDQSGPFHDAYKAARDGLRAKLNTSIAG